MEGRGGGDFLREEMNGIEGIERNGKRVKEKARRAKGRKDI